MWEETPFEPDRGFRSLFVRKTFPFCGYMSLLQRSSAATGAAGKSDAEMSCRTHTLLTLVLFLLLF